MGTTGAICVGAALGLVGSLPPAALFELALRKTRPVSVAAGFVGIMASFTILVVALLAVWAVARTELLLFGCAEAASFLLVWAVEAWRAWRDANAPARPGERNSGESTRQAS
jgi:hypothetical protein